MAKNFKNCASQSFVARADTAKSGGVSFLEAPEHGVWAFAQNLPSSNDAVQEQSTAAYLLDCLAQQVASGEDLTAAMLIAHGRAQRDCDGEPARIVALRLNQHTASFELAWVGDVQAYLVRKKQALRLSKPAGDDAALGEEKKNSFHMNTVRVAGLGGKERARPVIDRKLGHAQTGDMMVLAGTALEGDAFTEQLVEHLAGVWSLPYKAQCLQSALNKQVNGGNCLPVVLWRLK